MKAIKFFIFIVFILIGCQPQTKREIRRPSEALSIVRINYPLFNDDMGYKELESAINRSIKYLLKLDPSKGFKYGKDIITCKEVIESQKMLLNMIRQRPDIDELNMMIMERFKVYKAAGRKGKGDVLFTGYYEPIFDARLKPDNVYKYPIYKRPRDLIVIDLGLFSRRLKGQKIIARISRRKVLPYYSREEIELKNRLKGRHLEIAYLKSFVDLMFLQIQGSGKLRLADGRIMNVGYSISNGRQYRSIGRYLIDNGYISKDRLSMQSIRDFLNKRPDLWANLVRYNPSYVFFRVRRDGPRGNINVLLTPQRSIALDYRLFPKGALAFIRTKKPVLDENGKIVEWKRFSRFVLNQDTGGAIRGAGRVDIYFGTGDKAGIMAGSMKQIGELYILVKRPAHEKESLLIRKLRKICYFLKKHFNALN